MFADCGGQGVKRKEHPGTIQGGFHWEKDLDRKKVKLSRNKKSSDDAPARGGADWGSVHPHRSGDTRLVAAIGYF